MRTHRRERKVPLLDEVIAVPERAEALHHEVGAVLAGFRVRHGAVQHGTHGHVNVGERELAVNQFAGDTAVEA